MLTQKIFYLFFTIVNQVRSICCSFRAVSHSAGCHSALSHTALDFIPRYLTQRRMSSRAISHNAGWNPYVSDFIPRCRTQRRISSRAVAHSAGFHPALSHTTQDVIPRYLTQRRMSSRAISHIAGFHPALSKSPLYIKVKKVYFFENCLIFVGKVIVSAYSNLFFSWWNICSLCIVLLHVWQRSILFKFYHTTLEAFFWPCDIFTFVLSYLMLIYWC